MGDCQSPHESAEGAVICAAIDDDREVADGYLSDWNLTELRDFISACRRAEVWALAHAFVRT